MSAATLTRRAGDQAAALAEGLDLTAWDPPACLPDPDLDGPEEAPPDTPPEEPEPEPEIAKALPEQVTVTIPSSGPGVPASTVRVSRLDYNELRRLRAEGLSWAELKTRFKLPGQVLRAVAGDVDPHQAEQARAAKPPTRPSARSTTVPKVRADGKPRRRAATREENLTMAGRIHAGESPVTVAASTGFAVSTVQATYRWAKRERLLDQEEAGR